MITVLARAISTNNTLIIILKNVWNPNEASSNILKFKITFDSDLFG